LWLFYYRGVLIIIFYYKCLQSIIISLSGKIFPHNSYGYACGIFYPPPHTDIFRSLSYTKPIIRTPLYELLYYFCKKILILKKILIIRFSSIGDIVLTTPVLRCLKQQINSVEIHFLTKKQFFPLLQNNPNIDKIHFIEKRLKEVIPQLKSKKFDYIIDLHKNIRSISVILRLRKPFSTFKKLNLKKWLLTNFKINLLPKIHIVDRYMKAAKHFNIKNDYKGLDYFIPKDEEINIDCLPQSHQKGYIGFVIGAKHITKQLPENKIISVCQKINKPIVLLGDERDRKNGEVIKKIVGDKIFNACGLYNINQSASLIKQAEKIITTDTGLMHIAAALKKDILSIWGNTVPEFGMYPYFSKDAQDKSKIIENKNLSCRPCSKLGFKKCPKKHFKCMNLIDEQEIIKWIKN